MVKLLLKYDPNINIKDKHGKLIYQRAKTSEIARIIQESSNSTGKLQFDSRKIKNMYMEKAKENVEVLLNKEFNLKMLDEMNEQLKNDTKKQKLPIKVKQSKAKKVLNVQEGNETTDNLLDPEIKKYIDIKIKKAKEELLVSLINKINTQFQQPPNTTKRASIEPTKEKLKGDKIVSIGKKTSNTRRNSIVKKPISERLISFTSEGTQVNTSPSVLTINNSYITNTAAIRSTILCKDKFIPLGCKHNRNNALHSKLKIAQTVNSCSEELLDTKEYVVANVLTERVRPYALKFITSQDECSSI